MRRLEILGIKDSIGVVSMHSAIAVMLVEAVDNQGMSSDKILTPLGISKADLYKTNTRICATALSSLWRDAVKITSNELLSVNFAEQFKAASLEGLDFTLATCDTLLEATYCLARFYKVISTGGTVHVDVTEDTVRLWLEIPIPAKAAFSPSIDSAITLFLQLFRLVCAEKLIPAHVELQRLPPLDETLFNNFFLCPIKYQSAENALIFKRSDAEKKLPMSNSRLAQANKQVVLDYIVDVENNDISARVVCEIIKSLPKGLHSQNFIASQLCMSTRTLQRRLAGSQTSFSKLLNQSRKKLALQYLENSQQSVGEISHLLGFSEPSNFTRFFKRLTGESPSSYFS